MIIFILEPCSCLCIAQFRKLKTDGGLPAINWA
jgi:hypothetical protein